MTLRCVKCGRRLKRAAATIGAEQAGPMPHPPGPVGPTCAIKLGLMVPKATLFARASVSVRRVKVVKAVKRDDEHLDLLMEAGL